MDITAIQNKAIPVLKNAGVIRSSLFGSSVKGVMRADSDIDFLVEFPRGKTLLDLGQLKLNLELVLEKQVDLVTYKSISPYLRDRILADQVLLYE